MSERFNPQSSENSGDSHKENLDISRNIDGPLDAEYDFSLGEYDFGSEEYDFDPNSVERSQHPPEEGEQDEPQPKQ